MSPTHWLIVLGVLVLLFGAKKLPQMARSVGQSARVIQGEMKGLRDDERPTSELGSADQAWVEAATAPNGAEATGSVVERPAG